MPLKNFEQLSESHCWLGGPQTGKTQALVDRACSLVCADENFDSVDTPDVLLLCATPAEVARVRARIEDVLGSRASSVRVTLISNIALEIMAEPEARALFGRKPRLLDSFEERFLLEDVRTTRFKGRRLRKVMNFLRAGWSRLADDDPAWLVTLEEEAVANTLRDNLRFTGGIMTCELANLAVNTLRAHENVRKHYEVTHVLVDDYSLLDRASQLLARMLAQTSFSLASDSCPTPLAPNDFPYPQGVKEFLDDYPDTQVHTLENSAQPAQLASVVAHLQAQSEQLLNNQAHKKSFSARYAELMRQGAASRTNPQTDTKTSPRTSASESQTGDFAKEENCKDQPCLEIRMERELADELRAVTLMCQHAVESGENVLVISTSGMWRRRVVAELQRAGVALKLTSEHIVVRDFRDEQGCARAKAATMARLKRNPHDGVAWRSAIGFGDYMARSAGLEKLRITTQQFNLDIEEALERLAAGTLEGAKREDPLYQPIAEAYERSIEALSAQEESCVSNDNEPSANCPRTIQDASNETQSFEEGTGHVIVCSPREAACIQASTVVFGGFVNGIIPSRAHLDAGGITKEVPARDRAQDLLLIRSVMGRASKHMVFTGFKRCDLETAERMELDVAHIKLYRGTRMCDIRPSDYLPLITDTPAI